MNCSLCDQPIKDYNPLFHHLKIDETHSADICQDCIDKFVRWHGSAIAQLFPTTAMKKRYGANK
jgi:hypothetical protein